MTSLIAIVVVATALTWLYRTLAVRMLIRYETFSAAELARTASETLDVVATAARIPNADSATPPEVAQLRAKLEQRLDGGDLVSVRIYDRDGLTVFSTDTRQVGENGSDSQGFRQALEGSTANELYLRNQFSLFERSVMDRNLLSIYVPLRETRDGPVRGVLEACVDVTPFATEVEFAERTVLFGVSMFLLVLHFLFYRFVRRADEQFRAHENAERKAQQERMRHMAYHDALTGLPNRALFDECLQRAVARADRLNDDLSVHGIDGNLLGVMFIDLDRFKIINDSLGHESGDRVLVETARRINEAIRASDTACRIGGDEFVVILERLASVMEAERVAERLLRAFVPPIEIAGRDIIVSPSIGIALYPGATKQARRLVADAGAALQRAKETGRNRYFFYTEELNARVQETLEYERELRSALIKDQYVLHYQPRIDVETGIVVGMEALVRWHHPAGRLVPPDEFIDVLEDTGLIIAVGEWVIRQACQQCADWQRNGHPGVRVAVNISLKQFRSGSLVRAVERALAHAGLPAGCLELELTESVLLDDTQQAVLQLRNLREIGVHLTIDDFGTGYSSLPYLVQFPIGQLKIDRSLVQLVERRKDRAAVARMIAAMGRSLDLEVIAEGVETLEELRFLREIGCRLMQGNVFSVPVPVEESLGLLQPAKFGWVAFGPDHAEQRRLGNQ